MDADKLPVFKEAEIVLALVAPTGANLEEVQRILIDRIPQFGYEPNPVRITNLIGTLKGLTTRTVDNPPGARILSYMDAGNEVRKKTQYGGILGLAAAYHIRKTRPHHEEPTERTVHIVRSLKHPEEVYALRSIYGSGFFLLGVHAGRDERFEYLTVDKGISAEEATLVMERDEHEGAKLGQRTRDTFHLADAFVSSDCKRARYDIQRVLDLLFGEPFITPNRDEQHMFTAFSAALRSADLSRQVGAAVVSEDGELIATGANEVPAPGGGCYWEGDAADSRDFKLGHDSNERQRKLIAGEVVDAVLPQIDGGAAGRRKIRRLRDLVESTSLGDITEYGRVVHAEMEALLSAGRKGLSTVGATLFCTTFPCHNCAKHIVAAGVSRVVYVEPYPKSRALVLHSDSVAHGRGDGSKVVFEPFLGIGPRRFIDLFAMKLGGVVERTRKDDRGDAVRWARRGATPRLPMQPTSYLERELTYINAFSKMLEVTK